MRPLILDQDAFAKIARVIEYANTHPFSEAYLRGLADEAEKAGWAATNELPDVPGNIHHHCCVLRFGFRCVFTFEDQPAGRCRHLSVSLADAGDKAPNPMAVAALMRAFGFTCTLDACDCMYLEPHGMGTAVNVLQIIKQ